MADEPESAIEKAVTLIGSQEMVAKLLGNNEGSLTQQHVSSWVKRQKQAPAKYIKDLSKLTQGVVTVDSLLGDHERNARIKRKNSK